jgi:hypothetical protein
LFCDSEDDEPTSNECRGCEDDEPTSNECRGREDDEPTSNECRGRAEDAREFTSSDRLPDANSPTNPIYLFIVSSCKSSSCVVEDQFLRLLRPLLLFWCCNAWMEETAFAVNAYTSLAPEYRNKSFRDKKTNGSKLRIRCNCNVIMICGG